MTARPHVVIIGGGFGGLAAAQALADAPVRVTLIDRRNYHLFQPLLHGVALAELAPTDIAYPIRSILSKQANATVLLAEAKSIDAARKTVVLTDGELSYDYLIVAAGTCTNFRDQSWAEHSIGLKDSGDAVKIRNRILVAFEDAERETDERRKEALLTFVVIGGGATGVEVAGSLAELSRFVLTDDFRNIDSGAARIVLVQGADRILKEYGPAQSAKAEGYLRCLGVDVRTSTKVTAINAQGVQLSSGEFLPSFTVISCAGMRVSPVTESLGVPADSVGRTLVDPDLSVAAYPEIFVVGDAASFLHQDGKPLPGLAPVARQQGKVAAANIIASLSGRARKRFHYKHKGIMVTIGRSAAIADFGWLRLNGLLAWLTWLFIHVLFLVGFRNRFAVVFQWFWSFVFSQRGARMITGRLMKAGTQQLPDTPPDKK